MAEQPITWAKIKAAALDGSHPLVNEVDRTIKCPRCENWNSEADYHYFGITPRYHVYLVPIRKCPQCQYLFAVVN